MAESYFLWPNSQAIELSDLVKYAPSSFEVERLVEDIFPNSNPVLFSSARAGLTAVLQTLGLNRANKVWIPEFSSHCVIDAVGRLSMPSTDNRSKLSAGLIYHQWGWKHKTNFEESVCLIDDAVDTLFKPEIQLFTGSSSYILWSLPKVLGSLGGGVVFCHTEPLAEQLRVIRSQRSCSYIQAVLRLASKQNGAANIYWNGGEALHGELQGFARCQVARMLKLYPKLFSARLSKLYNLLGQVSFKIYDYDRLPSSIPLKVPSDWSSYWGESKVFSAGLRNFNVSRAWPSSVWEKVAPLPIHQDVPEKIMNILTKKISMEIPFNE